jgi:DNA-binding transcriptional regulator YiaG
MSKIATILKQEITRLARKEAKAETQVLRKANSQYRRDIAQLKRQAASLSKQVAFLQQQERKRSSKPASGVSTKGKRFSRRGLIAHRQKTGLSAADYGQLVGVSAQAVYNWESAKSKPREQQLAALVAVRVLGKREAIKRLELLTG